jgi:hypothetical protein
VEQIERLGTDLAQLAGGGAADGEPRMAKLANQLLDMLLVALPRAPAALDVASAAVMRGAAATDGCGSSARAVTGAMLKFSRIAIAQ